MRSVTFDPKGFVKLLLSLFLARHRANGDRRWIVTDGETGEQRSLTIRELTPGYDKMQWSGRRFLDDWTDSRFKRRPHRRAHLPTLDFQYSGLR
ncbi:protein of unknown function (plasmid) [Caballeronia sp. S22]